MAASLKRFDEIAAARAKRLDEMIARVTPRQATERPATYLGLADYHRACCRCMSADARTLERVAHHLRRQLGVEPADLRLDDVRDDGAGAAGKLVLFLNGEHLPVRVRVAATADPLGSVVAFGGASRVQPPPRTEVRVEFGESIEDKASELVEAFAAEVRRSINTLVGPYVARGA